MNTIDLVSKNGKTLVIDSDVLTSLVNSGNGSKQRFTFNDVVYEYRYYNSDDTMLNGDVFQIVIYVVGNPDTTIETFKVQDSLMFDNDVLEVEGVTMNNKQKQHKLGLLKEAQGLINEAMELIEEAVEDTDAETYATAYTIPTLATLIDDESDYLGSNSGNVQSLIELVEDMDVEDDDKLTIKETRKLTWNTHKGFRSRLVIKDISGANSFGYQYGLFISVWVDDKGYWIHDSKPLVKSIDGMHFPKQPVMKVIDSFENVHPSD